MELPDARRKPVKRRRKKVPRAEAREETGLRVQLEALPEAILEGQLGLLQGLLDAKADVDIEIDYEPAPEDVSFLLCPQPSVEWLSGVRPLQLAAAAGKLEVVQLLLERRARLQATGSFLHGGQVRPCSSPLHLAVMHGHVAVTELLLERKSSVQSLATFDSLEAAPLHLAAQRGHLATAQLLLHARASLHGGHEGIDVQTPLELALQFQPQMVPELFVQASLCDGSEMEEALVQLIHHGGPTAVRALEAWPQEAFRKDGTALKTSRLRQRLLAVLAPEEGLDDEVANLVWAPEVGAALNVLPGLRADKACRARTLMALAYANTAEVFSTDAIQAITSAAWQQCRAAVSLDISLNFCSLLCLCYASYVLHAGVSAPTTVSSLWLVALFHLKKTVEEFVQIVFHPCVLNVLDIEWYWHHSVLDFDNFADWGYLLVGWLAILRQFASDSLEKPFMSLFCALAWLRLLYSLRGESWLGPRLLPILAALKDTFAFFLVTFICLLAATHAYYNLQVRLEPSPVYAAFMQVMRLGIFGDFDMFEFEGQDPTFQLTAEGMEPVDPLPSEDYMVVHAVFYATGFGITILLMNLLVGVLGNNFDLYQDQSEVLFHRARSKLLLELKGRPWALLEALVLRRLRRHREEMPGWSWDLVIGLAFGPMRACLGRDYWHALRGRFYDVHKCYHGVWLLALCSPVMGLISLLFSGFFAACSLVFRWQGLSHLVAGGFDIWGRMARAAECQIFLLVRLDPAMDDLRSVRTELRSQLQNLKQELREVLQLQVERLESVEKRQQRLEDLLESGHERLQKQLQLLQEKL